MILNKFQIKHKHELIHELKLEIRLVRIGKWKKKTKTRSKNVIMTLKCIEEMKLNKLKSTWRTSCCCQLVVLKSSQFRDVYLFEKFVMNNQCESVKSVLTRIFFWIIGKTQILIMQKKYFLSCNINFAKKRGREAKVFPLIVFRNNVRLVF